MDDIGHRIGPQWAIRARRRPWLRPVTRALVKLFMTPGETRTADIRVTMTARNRAVGTDRGIVSARAVGALAALLLCLPMLAHAHEARPAYLALTEIEQDTFEAEWRVPARGAMRLGLYARTPASCPGDADPVTYQAGGAFVERWTMRCRGGLAGQSITIDGLRGTLTDVLARIEYLDGASQVVRLTPDEPSFIVAATPSRWEIAGTYMALGIEHILFGIDHLLFVLALLFLVAGWRRLVATITAFTIAHSMTLIAASLGVLWVPVQVVEAVIALSIVFVAAEIVHVRQGRPGLTRRWPWLVAFVFGLLHGLGFAGALQSIGLPEQAIVLALLCFNVGVEIGQLLFIAVALVVMHGLRRLPAPRAEWLLRAPAYGIGTLASFWTLQRVVGIWW